MCSGIAIFNSVGMLVQRNLCEVPLLAGWILASGIPQHVANSLQRIPGFNETRLNRIDLYAYEMPLTFPFQFR